MQREVGLNENSLLNAIERLRIAVNEFKSAKGELERAKKAYEDANDAIMPDLENL